MYPSRWGECESLERRPPEKNDWPPAAEVRRPPESVAVANEPRLPSIWDQDGFKTASKTVASELSEIPGQ